MSTKVQENYLRRWAVRLGYSLEKSKAKKWRIGNRGGWQIVDARTNEVVWGAGYSETLQTCDEWLLSKEKELTKA